jgi:hypothetical protein
MMKTVKQTEHIAHSQMLDALKYFDEWQYITKWKHRSGKTMFLPLLGGWVPKI